MTDRPWWQTSLSANRVDRSPLLLLRRLLRRGRALQHLERLVEDGVAGGGRPGFPAFLHGPHPPGPASLPPGGPAPSGDATVPRGNGPPLRPGGALLSPPP